MPTPVIPEALSFESASNLPNNPRWPLLLYRGALDVDPAAGSEPATEGAVRLFAANGWLGWWVGAVYPYPHYHPDAHEALAVIAGSATIQFGGDAGREVHVEAGDVVVLPAGTGHEQIEGTADFGVVGAYPEGQEDFETLRADGHRPPADRAAMAAVSRPAADPVYGPDGPLLHFWPA